MPAQPPDLLVGSAAIHAFLVELGMPARTDPYYLRRSKRWPIGRTTTDRGSGGKLVASRRRLREYVEEIARGPPLGKNFLISKLRLGRHAKKAAARRGKRTSEARAENTA
jgi:hypothetical protein